MIAAFEGWNDAGESATSALRYLAAAIRSVPVAEIDGEEFLDFTVRRPLVRFGADGERVIDWPGTRFRFGSADPSRELVVAHGVEPHVQWRRYCDLFAAVVARLRVRRVVLLGAYVADVVYSRPVLVTGFASEPGLLESIEVLPSSYEGPTGIVGVLGERLQRDGRRGDEPVGRPAALHLGLAEPARRAGAAPEARRLPEARRRPRAAAPRGGRASRRRSRRSSPPTRSSRSTCAQLKRREFAQ